MDWRLERGFHSFQHSRLLNFIILCIPKKDFNQAEINFRTGGLI